MILYLLLLLSLFIDPALSSTCIPDCGCSLQRDCIFSCDTLSSCGTSCGTNCTFYCNSPGLNCTQNCYTAFCYSYCDGGGCKQDSYGNSILQCLGGYCGQFCNAANCTSTCDGGGCYQRCNSGNCGIRTCDKGGCKQECSGTCSDTCNGGNCEQINNNEVSFVRYCDGGNCTKKCFGSCTDDCLGGNCVQVGLSYMANLILNCTYGCTQNCSADCYMECKDDCHMNCLSQSSNICVLNCTQGTKCTYNCPNHNCIAIGAIDITNPITIIDTDWDLFNPSVIKQSLQLIPNISLTIGPLGQLTIEGDFIVDGHLTLYLNSNNYSLIIYGCLNSSQPIDIYLPKDYIEDFTAIRQNSNCTTIPIFNIISSYTDACYELDQRVEIATFMYVEFSYVDTCSTTRVIAIVLGIVLSLIGIGCILSGYLIYRNQQRLKEIVLELMNKMPDSLTEQSTS